MPDCWFTCCRAAGKVVPGGLKACVRVDCHAHDGGSGAIIKMEKAK